MLPKRYLFDSFIEDVFAEGRNIDMKCDIYEQDNEYHIVADIPGVSKDNIKVEYEDGYVKVSVFKTEEKEDASKNYIRKERYSGVVERQFHVGNVDQNMIDASFENGTLKIKLPIKAKTNKLIEIK
ncbi:MAG: Hsp20/alpha crystallin family protein [Bacilli bacterium]|nr:Hsp20/alpha crystallin family protein [Bacilli bacterium]